MADATSAAADVGKFETGLPREPRRYGREGGKAGVQVRELTGFGLAGLTARKGRFAALQAATEAAFGAALPTSPRRFVRPQGGGLAFVGHGPERWLVHAAAAPVGGMEAHLASGLGADAAIVDLSHARIMLHLSGSQVRACLAKGVAIDLHPRAFATGDAVTTVVGHITIDLWQVADEPVYAILAPRSLALSFWHWLEAASAEFGLDVLPSA